VMWSLGSVEHVSSCLPLNACTGLSDCGFAPNLRQRMAIFHWNVVFSTMGWTTLKLFIRQTHNCWNKEIVRGHQKRPRPPELGHVGLLLGWNFWTVATGPPLAIMLAFRNSTWSGRMNSDWSNAMPKPCTFLQVFGDPLIETPQSTFSQIQGNVKNTCVLCVYIYLYIYILYTYIIVMAQLNSLTDMKNNMSSMFCTRIPFVHLLAWNVHFPSRSRFPTPLQQVCWPWESCEWDILL
jgi:hypothetical protein